MATLAQAKRALDLFEADLSRRKNVVGLGIVPAEENETASGPRGLAVAIYVKKKLPENRLAAKDRVPETLIVAGRRGPVEVPTRVIEQGEVKLESVERASL
jgi:hypothetical protein